MKKSLRDIYAEAARNYCTSSFEFNSLLLGSFNQDIESLETALKEYINEAIKDPERMDLKLTIQGIEEFLENVNYTDEEKEEFLNTSIGDKNDKGITHLEWLRQIVLPEMIRNL